MFPLSQVYAFAAHNSHVWETIIGNDVEMTTEAVCIDYLARATTPGIQEVGSICSMEATKSNGYTAITLAIISFRDVGSRK